MDTQNTEYQNDDQNKWEYWKYKIREFSVEFSKAKVKHHGSKTHVIEKRLKSLEENLNNE